MDENKSMGLFLIIIGLLFIIFPMFSAELVSIIVGFSLLFFGISAIFTGWNMRYTNPGFLSGFSIIIGIIIVILGFLFIFYIDAVSFLIGIQFYIIGFIMILFGISGLLARINRMTLFTSVLMLVMGIIAIALAAFAMAQPVYIAIIIGVFLVIEGIVIRISD